VAAPSERQDEAPWPAEVDIVVTLKNVGDVVVIAFEAALALVGTLDRQVTGQRVEQRLVVEPQREAFGIDGPLPFRHGRETTFGQKLDSQGHATPLNTPSLTTPQHTLDTLEQTGNNVNRELTISVAI